MTRGCSVAAKVDHGASSIVGRPWRIGLLLGAIGFAAVRIATAGNDCPGNAVDSGSGCSLWPLKDLLITTSEGTWMALDVSPDGNTITFELLGKIFTLPIDGGQATQLTTGSAFDEMPRFTRDGRHIVFSSDRGNHTDLWRVAREGGTPALATLDDRAGVPMALDINGTNADRATWPATDVLARDAGEEGGADGVSAPPTTWSADGRYGVRSTRPGRARLYDTRECREYAQATLMLVERSTGSTRPLAPAGPDCMRGASMPASAFTPDGRAFITSHSGKLWRIAIPSGEAQSILFTAEVRLQVRPRQTFSHRIADEPFVHARVIEHARVSADLKQVVFGAFDHIWTQSLPKGTPRRLTQLDVGEFQPVWSPDGRYVAFITWDDRKKDGAIWRIPVNSDCVRKQSCRPERLTVIGGRYMHLAYAPDGRRIAAMEARVGGRVGTFSATPFWISASGGTPTYFGQKRNLNVEFSDLYFSPADPERVMEVQTLAALSEHRPQYYNVRCVIGRQSLAGSAALGGETPALSITDAPRADPPWQRRNGRDYPCAGAVSPQETQVVFRRINGELYLLDLPQQFSSGTQNLSLSLDSARRISAPGLGGDDPAWSADGRLISFTFGHTLYLYRPGVGTSDRVADGSLQAIPIDVVVPRAVPTGAVAFRNARLVTLRADEVIEQGDLVVRGRRIEALGLAGTVSIPADARLIDGRGLTLIPGLLDLHNHGLTQTFEPRVHASRNAVLESNLAFGVLNSRDPQSQVTDVVTTEDLIEAGRMLAPRIRTTFAGVGNSSATYLQDMERAREVAHRYGTAGLQVGYMKEYVSGPRRQRQYLVMAAAGEGLNVTSHGTGLKHLLTNAIDGYGGFDHPIVTTPLYDDVLQLLEKTQIAWADNNWRWALSRYLVPKLTAGEHRKLRRLFKPREYGNLKGSLDSLLERDSSNPESESGADRDAQGAMRMAASLAAAIKKGVRIVNGSHGDDLPGLGTHLQVWAYVEGGASPLEALRASTLWSAEALDWGTDLGSLEVGKLADLIVLERNPLERIQNTIAIRYVMFNGRLYDAETLKEVPLPRQ